MDEEGEPPATTMPFLSAYSVYRFLAPVRSVKSGWRRT